jgi:hypothetical protein
LTSKAYPQEDIDTIIDQLKTEYEKVEPPTPNSSINSDYPIKQTAIGIFYSAKLMSHLVKQNQILNRKQEQFLEINRELIQKYNVVIKQNNDIIRLLKVIAERQEK